MYRYYLSVEHPDATDLRVEGNAHDAQRVVGRGGHLARAPRPVPVRVGEVVPAVSVNIFPVLQELAEHPTLDRVHRDVEGAEQGGRLREAAQHQSGLGRLQRVRRQPAVPGELLTLWQRLDCLLCSQLTTSSVAG